MTRRRRTCSVTETLPKFNIVVCGTIHRHLVRFSKYISFRTIAWCFVNSQSVMQWLLASEHRRSLVELHSAVSKLKIFLLWRVSTTMSSTCALASPSTFVWTVAEPLWIDYSTCTSKGAVHETNLQFYHARTHPLPRTKIHSLFLWMHQSNIPYLLDGPKDFGNDWALFVSIFCVGICLKIDLIETIYSSEAHQFPLGMSFLLRLLAAPITINLISEYRSSLYIFYPILEL